MNSPITVGITGGIGSGKSIVGQLFTLLGIPVYDADTHAKTLMSTDSELMQSLRESFGPKVFSPDGALNRNYISSIIFEDKQKLEQINQLIHPAVERDFQTWLDQHHHVPYVLKEAALLVETGSYKKLDFLITVFSSQEQRLSRLRVRDPHRSKETVEAIMARQTSDKEKLAVSDFSIDNTGGQLVLPQVLKIHHFLLNHHENGKLN